jgi:predicted GIY-YIG superfamily endonuclease
MTGALSPQAAEDVGTVYLIHLQRPYRHARHYLGWTLDVERRLAQPRAGGGSSLLRAAVATGIPFELAHTWPGDRHLERRLHRYKNTPARLCPICRSETPESSR